MKLSKLFSILENSAEYKTFKKESKNAFFCAAFSILNFKDNIFQNSLDFRDSKNIFSFKIQDSGKIEATGETLLKGKKPLEKINLEDADELKIDIEDLKDIAERELKKNKIASNLNEIIAVLQNHEKKLIWNLTCMCEGFTIISLHVDALSGETLKFEKRNLMDFVSVRKPDKK